MNIKILGSGCNSCVTLERVTREALTALGADAEFEKVTDDAEIASYGVMRTPGLVIDDELVLAGRVPHRAQVAELLAPRLGAAG